MLQCHLAIDYNINPIKSIVCLKEINDIFNNRLPMLNSKQSKEVFSCQNETIILKARLEQNIRTTIEFKGYN